ncbi:MAG: hypothetical protein H7X77_04640 [Anaerolineae bacterium]|nr:hypothetical protein [Anaerolineae bacterium]
MQAKIRSLYLVMILIGLLTLTGIVAAQESTGNPTADAAIVLASEHEAFAAGLEAHPGWTADAYDTQNSYGIWRVQFWNAEGEELGWADVNPAKSRVYSWESYVGVTDAQRAEAEPFLREFLSTAPEILELMENPTQYDMYVDFDSSSGYWGTYIANGEDSLYVVVDFEDDTAFTSPRVVRFYFEVMDYGEWFAANEELAAAKAFEQPEIADALRGIEDWQATAERAGNMWTVSFKSGEQVLAQATVDLDQNLIVDYTVGG